MTQSKSRATELDVFCGETAPCDHVVQIYADDTTFLDSLAGFIAEGLKAEESVIVIATTPHRYSLEFRLRALGFNLAAAVKDDRYLAIDAEGALTKFMVGRWPDSDRFEPFVTDLLSRARKNRRRVRAFGEMVAILWAKGQSGATLQLEQLWNEFCKKEAFSLFCAYPRSGFTKDADASIQEICSAHSKVISIAPPARHVSPG
jgi:hypothetical protein